MWRIFKGVSGHLTLNQRWGASLSGLLSIEYRAAQLPRCGGRGGLDVPGRAAPDRT
jgi:hypothetical protein